MGKSKKIRIDSLLVKSKLAESDSRANALLMAGCVRIGDQIITKPGTLVETDAQLIVEHPNQYVSRAAYKLKAALESFGLEVSGRTCADIGAATGGFSQILLEGGVSKVYAIDVGYGDLALKVRDDPRVIVMERTNVRDVATLPEQLDLIAVDVSFISVKQIVAKLLGWLKIDGELVVLIKPQFEAARDLVPSGGVVTNTQTHKQVLEDVISYAASQGAQLHGLLRSPITGSAGNQEFLALFRLAGSPLVDNAFSRERVLTLIEEVTGGILQV